MGHHFVQCCMVFDINMDDFRCKAQLAAGGYMAKAQATVTYAIVLSRKMVRIVLMIAALNDLEVKSAVVLNAYVQAPVTERCGPYCVMSLVVMLHSLVWFEISGSSFLKSPCHMHGIHGTFVFLG